MAGKIFVVGIGPGIREFIIPYAENAILRSDYVVGYTSYIEKLLPIFPHLKCFAFPMGKERERAEKAVELARRGYTVTVVSSGDPGIYGMASLVFDLAGDLEVEVIPGISALSFCASRIGSPLGGDFVLISLSDLITPWRLILHNLEKAASMDAVIVIINPGSKRRKRNLSEAAKIIMHYRSSSIPVAIVENAYTENERVSFHVLSDIVGLEFSNMNATIFIGTQRTKVLNSRMVTDRGYNTTWDIPFIELGREVSPSAIETRSLEFVKFALSPYNLTSPALDVIARVVHAVGDFSIVPAIVYSYSFFSRAVEALKRGVKIVVDTEMAFYGINKKLAEKIGCEVIPVPKEKPPSGYTQTAWGLRRISHVIQDAFVVIGNAPTALRELIKLIGEGIEPACVVGVPVGFVDAASSKLELSKLEVPFFTVMGNRGGTPVAVAVVNALLKITLANFLEKS